MLYRDEATAGGQPSALNTDLIHEIAHRPHGIIPLPADIAQEVDDKLQRTLPEYAPQNTCTVPTVYMTLPLSCY